MKLIVHFAAGSLIRVVALIVGLMMTAPVAAGELVRAAPEEVGVSSEKLEKIDEAIGRLVDEKKTAGAVVMVARRGRVIYAEAFGMMDVEAQKPMRLDTIFRIYSMSKPVTTVGAMMLSEEGKLKLDDPVSKYLPEFRGLKVHDVAGQASEPAREMTVRDLMRHTSGLTYGVFGDTPVDRKYRQAGILDREDTLAEMTAKLGGIPLLYPPGTKWQYSVSVDVLGRLIEVASEQPLDEFFQERIFRPLEMRDTGFYVPEDKRERFASNYEPDPAGGLRVKDAAATSRYLKNPAFFSGGGGLVSTGGDYMRFCQMMLSGGRGQGHRLLGEQTVRAMTRNQLSDELTPIAFGNEKRHGTGFGLGFSVRVADTDWDPAGAVGEYGWGGAASTHFWISPERELAVVALQQYMPFTFLIEQEVKPLVYDAIVD